MIGASEAYNQGPRDSLMGEPDPGIYTSSLFLTEIEKRTPPDTTRDTDKCE